MLSGLLLNLIWVKGFTFYAKAKASRWPVQLRCRTWLMMNVFFTLLFARSTVYLYLIFRRYLSGSHPDQREDESVFIELNRVDG